MNLCPTCGFTKDGPLHRDYCRDGQNRSIAVKVLACPCECNEGQFCGGCGHAGCGGRAMPRRDHLRPTATG